MMAFDMCWCVIGTHVINGALMEPEIRFYVMYDISILCSVLFINQSYKFTVIVLSVKNYSDLFV